MTPADLERAALALPGAAEVADWLKTAHELVAGKLTRKQRVEPGIAG